jgi:hypothetical protein
MGFIQLEASKASNTTIIPADVGEYIHSKCLYGNGAIYICKFKLLAFSTILIFSSASQSHSLLLQTRTAQPVYRHLFPRQDVGGQELIFLG